MSARGPEAVGEHDCAGGIGSVVPHVDQAAEHGAEAHHLEEVATDHAGLHFAGFAEAVEGEAHGGEIAERAEGLHALAKILDFGHGENGALHAQAGRALPDVDQPVFAAIHQRP